MRKKSVIGERRCWMRKDRQRDGQKDEAYTLLSLFRWQS